MAEYWRVSSRFWTDEKVAGWDQDTRMLALYLLTCPHRTMEGLFRLPKQYIMADLQWSAERLAKPFAKLLADGFIDYDETVSVILLRNALKYQSPQNPNQVKAALDAIEELPRTRLLLEFQRLAERFCERLAQGLRERFGQRLAEQFEEPCRNHPPNGSQDGAPAGSAGAAEGGGGTAGESGESLAAQGLQRFGEPLQEPFAERFAKPPAPSPAPSPSPKESSSSGTAEAAPDGDESGEGPTGQEGRRPRQPRYGPEHMALAERLRDRILENKPDAKLPKDLSKWAETARLMVERDGRSPERIAAMIDWCQRDEFWRANIMSMDALRKHFDRLELQAKRRRGPVQSGARHGISDWSGQRSGVVDLTAALKAARGGG